MEQHEADETEEPSPPSEPIEITPPSEGFSYAQICALLGVDPASTRALTITESKVVAVSTAFIEPLEDTHGE